MLVASMAAGVLGGCGNGDAAGTSSVSGGTESAGSGASGDVVELTDRRIHGPIRWRRH